MNDIYNLTKTLTNTFFQKNLFLDGIFLHVLFLQVLFQCFAVGLNIVATVWDLDNVNKRALAILEATVAQLYINVTLGSGRESGSCYTV